ncbi:hypothetical protein MA16_Dca021698 [Dendrobium catenatum]|uniref:Uncharacterized protein n=1 Tax=Dendrobium catenatum TaxID=906689 RepID=A0A2I0W633_9ASPA|nr:hypothetical protein MA16_Dca021698 [Dendrobium catenatum]
MLRSCSEKISIGFIRYEQSSKCKSMKDSSVSYASAAAKLDGGGSRIVQDDLKSSRPIGTVENIGLRIVLGTVQDDFSGLIIPGRFGDRPGRSDK